MQETVFVVKGKPNSGKTSTIKLVYERLLKEENHIPIVEFKFIDCCDFRSVVILSNYRIGFLSYGDAPKKLEEHLSKIQRIKCSIIICATRESGNNDQLSTTDEVVKSLEPEYKIRFIGKTKSKHRLKKTKNQENEDFANEIYRYIFEAINES